MFALCQSNLGSSIPLDERYLGEMDQTDYSPLRVGENYEVYALLFVFDRVDFLVRAPEQPPFWVPNSLFRLVDSTVPSDWEFCITRSCVAYKPVFDEFKISYVMGYPLLVQEYKHFVGIIERDPVELQRFFEAELRRKMLI